MIPPEFINQTANKLSDSQLLACLKDSLFQALQMLSLQSKPEHAKMVFDGILHIIRKKFNDLSAGELDTALQMGLYGNYGDFTRVNPKTILEWLGKRRLEISRANELKEQSRSRNEDICSLFSASGGKAVLLGLCYNSMGIEMSFQERLILVETDGVCPNTGKRVFELINESVIHNNLVIGKKI
jgi:hypothetical protein